MSDGNKELHGFFNDDGTPMNPDLVPKPALCVMCKHDGDPNQGDALHVESHGSAESS